MATALLGGLGAAAGGALFNRIVGGKNRSVQASPMSFTAPGISGMYSGGGATITRSPETTGLLQDIKSVYDTQATDIAGLRDQVTPGMGRLTESALMAIANSRRNFENQRRSAIGNLRENLSRRRVLGSSFGMDALSRAEAEFANKEKELFQAENEIKARSFLQELDLRKQLINEETAARLGGFQVKLNQLGLEAQVATDLATGGNSVINTNNQLRANLLAESAKGTGAFFQPYAQQIGSAVANYFNPPPSTGNYSFTPSDVSLSSTGSSGLNLSMFGS